MNPNILSLLNKYADDHNKLQLDCYVMSSVSNTLGFPGASTWFQIQAQDEVLHTRKIYNYLIGRDEILIVNPIQPEEHNEKSLLELMEKYLNYKLQFIEKTNTLIAACQETKDFLTIKFLDWFLIDFYEEIELAKTYIDKIKMSNNNYYGIDKYLSKREEPDTLKVIVPYSVK
ncbi:ferritin-like domain-containing protein [Spiroplasma endosymbiont of Asaphidion curtum]|uniref:ferritin-like domain-containing protein n=1 Tax=Spiroplasma endosymbiont of Asaphidion curtum TaxID=3066281 RepID=UPI00313D0ABA